jgi:HK97 family phage prohead protease
MPANKVHHSPTSFREWDGPRVRWEDQDSACRAAAFVQDGAPVYLHHFVDGPASVVACRTAIDLLNDGAMIPDADRRAVWAHLSTHLRDAGLPEADIPAFREVVEGGVERRSFDFELRVEKADDGAEMLRGHAAVFNSASEEMGGYGFKFREMVAPGTFKDSIAKDDIRALFNHDPNYVLGRKSARTLSLKEDDRGLAVDIKPPATQWARDLMESIRRGDISQMSFGFRTIEDSWDYTKEGAEATRTLKKVQLQDVSPVTFPAYRATDVGCYRSLDLAGLKLPRYGALEEARTASGLSLLQARLDLAARE